MFPGVQEIQLAPDLRPVLLVVIDTEEEFDWSKPHDRNETAVEAMRFVERGQRLFDEFGIRPTYAIDYPVATQKTGIESLKPIVESGRAVLAAHLHPWVNPPHDEDVCAHNSYAGNLPADLERAKLRALQDAIERSFGLRPTVYKAGRYGLGENSAAILEEEGFDVDLSVCPPMDFRADGGPDYSGFPTGPFWFGKQRRLLEVPLSGAFLGGLRRAGPGLNRITRSALGERLHLPGILARARLLDLLRLSPEGFTHTEHRRLTDFLLRQGVRVFNFAFHSPSLEPGYTPYVRSKADLERLLDLCRRYFDYFLGKLGGVAMTPSELYDTLRNTHEGPGHLAA